MVYLVQMVGEGMDIVVEGRKTVGEGENIVVEVLAHVVMAEVLAHLVMAEVLAHFSCVNVS